MAQHNDEDEDTFTGRKLKSMKRRPLDLSLGYYLDANENVSIDLVLDNGLSINLQPSLSAVDASNDEATKPTNINANKVAASSDNLNTQVSEPVTVDHFLKATTRSNVTTRNYKQARKKRMNKKHVTLSLTDSKGDHHTPVQSSVTPKPRKAVSRSRTEHRAANALLVSGVKTRNALASPPILHSRWQPVKKVTVDADAVNSRSKLTVRFLPLGWNNRKGSSQTGKPKAPRKANRAPAVPTVPRSALTFEKLEDHDKKLDMWLTTSYKVEGETKWKVPYVRDCIPGRPIREVPAVHARLPLPFGNATNQPDKKQNNTLPLASNAKDVSGTVELLSPGFHPTTLQINDAGTHDEKAQRLKRFGADVDPPMGKKLSHLGDMLGDLRLNAKEFLHASGDVPSPG